MVLQNTGKYYADTTDQGGKGEDEGVDKRLEQAIINDEVDCKLGFERYKDYQERLGWLVNLHTSDFQDEEKRLVSAVDFYFIEEDGKRFKVTLPYKPYFYVACKDKSEREVAAYLMRKFAGKITSVDFVQKEDLDLHNHLIGLRRTYVKLSFLTTDNLNKVKRDVFAAVRKNQQALKKADALTEAASVRKGADGLVQRKPVTDLMECIIDIREHDVPFHCRVSIDLKINVGRWYAVRGRSRGEIVPSITLREDLLERPDAIVLAFDIETTKLPLKFPDASMDQIMMISYMIDGQGYLITNREIISDEIDDFEYTPKPEFEGPFLVFNEPDEESLIQKFIDHILQVKPHIITTYNGDSFDWPFVEARAAFHGIDIFREIGFKKDSQGEYKSRPIAHLDCFKWVKRDSYLPVGSQNLKAVAKAKLRYDPVELDPEEMCKMANEQPQVLATYSVSDAVATYYLYMKYVNPFIFALCTIIPLEPDEVLRKGSGTLCEALLMVQAYDADIIYPNKQETVYNKLTEDGHVLDSDTYVGGHVEAIESGVFRSDIPCKFRLNPEGVKKLIDNVEKTLKFTIEVEEKISLDQVLNFEEVYNDIVEKLTSLMEVPNRLENPIIYHLDVGAMYPNIILTNRLQPSAIVDEATCAACDFNKPSNRCQREMPWMWRGEVMSANRQEFQRIQQQLEGEMYPPAFPGGKPRAWHQLTRDEKGGHEKKRLKEFCGKAYKKVHSTRLEKKFATVCQRENSFYVDTVRAFRDRRYEFKGLTKVWNKKLADAKKSGDAAEIKKAGNMAVLYDSLQLAHKCILNSFYGYVMRKGARWYSMEMAGIVCHTGANIIKKAREITEDIGRPLELDTDGIWAALPATFPENYTIQTTNEKKLKVVISYPGAMLNVMVKDFFTNDQYNDLVDADKHSYSVRSENSIFFEVDGPYLAMILPAAKEEGKKLKKRYAVFNPDGTLAELKGFEVKRRGELRLIKIFQSSVFEAFLKGASLEEVYASVAKIADYWIDVLYSKAANMPDSELFDLISENRSMSRKLEDYGEQKSTSISTAKRLAEFLGDQMVKDAGLSCRFIISKKPQGSPVTERAIPLAIFQSESSVKKHYLRKWLKAPGLQNFDIRDILDWDYYLERLGGCIQKIITIPAALQGVGNPVPRIRHPDWLHKKMLEKNDVYKQKRLTDMFKTTEKPQQQFSDSEPEIEEVEVGSSADVADIEDMAANKSRTTSRIVVSKKRPREKEDSAPDVVKSWQAQLGAVPQLGSDKESIQAWIAYQKKKWAIQSEQKQLMRKRQRIDAISSQTNERVPTIQRGLGGFMQQTARSILASPWQILQIVETRDEGRYKAWVLIGSDLHAVTINVPRLFYVNYKRPREDGPRWRKVSRILPRGQEMLHLYENAIPEDFYLEHHSEITQELCTPDITGIYESNTPPMFRMLSNLGCVCTVSRNHVKSNGNKEIENFDLQNLEFRSLAQYPYLEDDTLLYIYLYHNSSASKEMFALFIPGTQKAHIFALDSVRVNNMPNLNTLYAAEYTSCDVPADYLPPPTHEYDVSVETSLTVINRGIHRLLSAYKDEKKGPTVIVVQSQKDVRGWHKAIPMTEEFPMVPLMHADGGSYNVLDWQKTASRLMIHHYLRAFELLAAHIQQSQYYHVPIGNMVEDMELFACDLFYSRHLKRANHVMWCSSNAKPDLGGRQTEDKRLDINDVDELPTINSPGFYLSACVEISIKSLVVDAILQSAFLVDADGHSNFDQLPQLNVNDMLQRKDVPNQVCYDDTALCTNAFRILKTMVHSWIGEIVNHENPLADEQINHFHRWLTEPGTLLYDPAMKKLIHQMTKKVFSSLIGEFQRLGAVIIYADFRRLVINTKKNNVEDALNYMEYILKSISSHQLYNTMDFRFVRAWDCLLWMDKANYSGIRSEFGKQLLSECEDWALFEDVDMSQHSQAPAVDIEETGDDKNLQSRLQSCWNVQYYLPIVGGCQQAFYNIVSSYIISMYNNFMDEQQNHLSGSTPMRKLNSQNTQVVSEGSLMPAIAEFATTMMAEDIAPKMYQLITSLHHDHGGSAKGDEVDFMDMPGSHIKFTSPALEVCKTICHVLSLDSHVTEKVTNLKLDLLMIVDVGQFSPRALFQNPSLSYVIDEMLCMHCHTSNELDLCRGIQVSDRGKVMPYWLCPNCHSKYNTAKIEMRLVTEVQKLVMEYTLQDAPCSKCKMVKMYNMDLYCNCSGKFTNALGYKEYQDRMRVFSNLARHFNLEYLREVITVTLQQQPILTPD